MMFTAINIDRCPLIKRAAWPRWVGLLSTLAVASLLTEATAQVCNPNLTAEQAYLTLKHPAKRQTATAAPIAVNSAPTAHPTLSSPGLAASKLINLNTASEAELTQLDGIGAKKAQDIILYRTMVARFASVDDLDNVKGIGKATIDKNRHRMTVR